MALYVIRPDDPPPGEDWRASVPGQYVYNITGIYATLDTGTPFGVMRDISGNANDGFYGPDSPYPMAVPGLVAGGRAVLWNSVPGQFPGASGGVGNQIRDWGTPSTFESWIAGDPTSAIGFEVVRVQGAAPAAQIKVSVNFDGKIACEADYSFPLGLFLSAAGAFPMDGAGHYLVVTYDGTHFHVTVDTVAVAPVTNIAAGVGATTATAFLLAGTSTSGADDGFTQQLVAVYPGQLSGARQAAHYAAATSSFAAYKAAVLADTPDAFWPLDDDLGGGRQVTLQITDSNNEVERIPSGFDVLSTPGPYAWSWLPKLNSAAENPDTATITVPLPGLIIPAGYTVGTKTLDIAPTDQWSDISVWWNSDYMDAQQELNPYIYPPGAQLVYRQIQGNP